MDRSGSKLEKVCFFLGGCGVSGEEKCLGGGMGEGGASGGGEAGVLEERVVFGPLCYSRMPVV